MKVRLGQVVHYVSYGTPGGEYVSQCRAALVTHSGPELTASLAVLNPTGLFFNTGLDYDDEHAGGTWHFIEDCDE